MKQKHTRDSLELSSWILSGEPTIFLEYVEDKESSFPNLKQKKDKNDN